jgi:hypothetical protein
MGCLTTLSRDTLRVHVTVSGVAAAVVDQWCADYKAKAPKARPDEYTLKP